MIASFTHARPQNPPAIAALLLSRDAVDSRGPSDGAAARRAGGPSCRNQGPRRALLAALIDSRTEAA